jgi:hypothetical protein
MITEIGTPNSHNKRPRMIVASSSVHANNLTGLTFQNIRVEFALKPQKHAPRSLVAALHRGPP